MSINLLALLKDGLGGQLASQASQFLGETPANTQNAVSAILPNLLGAVVHQGSTSEGANSLFNLLGTSAVNSGIMGNLSGLFSGGTATSALMSVGANLLQSVLGNKTNAMADAVGAASGLKSGSAMSLLSMAAPMVLGLLKSQATGQNAGVSGLMSLLAGQKEHLAGSLNPSILSSLGLGSVASFIGGTGATVGKTVAAAGAGATKAAGAAVGAAGATLGAAGGMAVGGAKKGGSFLTRWLPIILIAALALWLLNRCMGIDPLKKVADATQTVAGAAGDAAKGVAGAAGDAAKGVAGVAGDAAKGVAGAAGAAAGGVVDAAKGAAGAAGDAAKGVAGAAGAVVTDAAKAASEVAKFVTEGGKAIAGAPVAKLYFTSGSIALQADADKVLADAVKYGKDNAKTKFVISGFHDATGDAAQNELLAKNRAGNVQAALVKAGFGQERIELVKPASTTGTGDNKEARRVEVHLAAN